MHELTDFQPFPTQSKSLHDFLRYNTLHNKYYRNMCIDNKHANVRTRTYKSHLHEEIHLLYIVLFSGRNFHLIKFNLAHRHFQWIYNSSVYDLYGCVSIVHTLRINRVCIIDAISTLDMFGGDWYEWLGNSSSITYKYVLCFLLKKIRLNNIRENIRGQFA